MSARTLFDKVWSAHEVVAGDARIRRPCCTSICISIHEVTSPQAFSVLKSLGLPVRRPDRTLATMDHSTPTSSDQVFGRVPIKVDAAAKQVRQLEQNAADFGVELFGMRDARRGIVHVISPELGATQPGMTIVCGDSHTSTHGAFGALAFGIGTTEVGHVLATQCLLQRKPKTFAVNVEGKLPPRRHREGFDPRHHRQDGRVGRHRPRVRVPRLDHPRALDGGAHDGVQHVHRGRRARRHDRAGRDHLRVSQGQAARTQAARTGTPRSRAGEPSRAMRGAVFDASVDIDAAQLEPMITYGTNPGMVRADQRGDPGGAPAMRSTTRRSATWDFTAARPCWENR